MKISTKEKKIIIDALEYELTWASGKHAKAITTLIKKLKAP